MPFVIRPAAAVMAVSAVLVVGAFAVASNRSVRASASESPLPDTIAAASVADVRPPAAPARAKVVAPPEIETAPRIQTTPVPAVVETPRRTEVAAPVTSTPTPIVAPRPAVAAAETPVVSAAPVESPARTSLADSNVTAARSAQAPVTITGCLEATIDGTELRLTDTEGDAAPKARGWKSGFLKKRSAPVALIGLPDTAASRKLVGQRVAATGLLEDRDLRVRALQPAGGVCN